MAKIIANYANYYRLTNIEGDISAINNQQVPWYTGCKIGALSRSIKSNQDIEDNELFEILFESDDAYNIIDGLDYDAKTCYAFYFLKTKHSKLLGIVTVQNFDKDLFKVVYEFEFLPSLIFHHILLEVLADIIKPFLFQIPSDGPWNGDSYDVSQILDVLRAQSIMILLEDQNYTNVANNFKKLLLKKLVF